MIIKDEHSTIICSVCNSEAQQDCQLDGVIDEQHIHLILCDMCFKTALAALKEKKRTDKMFNGVNHE